LKLKLLSSQPVTLGKLATMRGRQIRHVGKMNKRRTPRERTLRGSVGRSIYKIQGWRVHRLPP
jgi:hypothetical protein